MAGATAETEEAQGKSSLELPDMAQGMAKGTGWLVWLFGRLELAVNTVFAPLLPAQMKTEPEKVCHKA